MIATGFFKRALTRHSKLIKINLSKTKDYVNKSEKSSASSAKSDQKDLKNNKTSSNSSNSNTAHKSAPTKPIQISFSDLLNEMKSSSKSSFKPSSTSPSSTPSFSFQIDNNIDHPFGDNSIRAALKAAKEASNKKSSVILNKTPYTEGIDKARDLSIGKSEEIKGSAEQVQNQILQSVLSTSAKTKTDTVEVRIPGIGKVRIDLEDDDPGEAEYQRRLENVKREKSKFHSKIAPRIASPYDQSMNDLSYSDIESAFEEKNAQLENVKSQPVENLLKVDDSTTDNDYLNSDIHSTSQIEIEESKNETRFDELDRDTLNISTLSEKATKDESEDLLSQTKTIASNIPTTTISDTDIDLEEMEDLLEKSADKSLSLEPLEASLDSLASLDDFDEDILPNDASFGLDDKDILLDDKDILPDEDVPPDLEDLAPKGVDQVLPTVPKGIYTVAELRILLEDSLKHQAKMLEQNKELFAAPSNTYIDAKGRRRRRKPVKPVSEKALEKMKKEKLKHTVIKEVAIPSVGLELRELASSLSMKSSELYKRLEDLGEIMPSEDGENGDPFGHIVDADTAELVVIDLGLIAKRQQAVQEISVGTYSRRTNNEQNISNVSMDLRPPVVCIMGHVDHGKTTLLDYLRSTNVAAKEAGGITQRLSAFSVDLKKGGRVVFLDTPGHAAFSAMRANGASATDLVVLVVAIDDGVRPQTIEAIQAAKSAGCPIVIALNKIDKLPPSERPASRNKVLAQLADVGVLAEEFGGDSLVVEVSGRTGEGVMDLIENLSIQAEIMDLRAPTEGLAEATVLDAGMEKGRGIVANILTRWGKLSVGDPIVVGTCYGKVKNLYLNDRESVRSVGPATPVLLTGLQSIPQAGQELISVPSESRARAISERRQRIIKIRDSELASVSISSDTVSPPTDDGLVPPIILSSLSILLKADSPGTLNALEKVVKGIISRCKEISIQIVSSGVGDITQSDIERLIVVKGANTCILGFNVNFVNSSVRSFAKESDVKIIRDAIVYHLEDEFKRLLLSLLPIERYLVSHGTAKVLKVFQLSGKEEAVVAGLRVETGTLKMPSTGIDYEYRVLREGKILAEGLKVSKLKRFKDTVNEVDHDNECGLTIEKYSDYAEGDLIECLKVSFRNRTISFDGNEDSVNNKKSDNLTYATNISTKEFQTQEAIASVHN